MMEHKERLKNCHGPKKSRETWQLNVMGYAGEKEDINGKTGEIQIKTEV